MAYLNYKNKKINYEINGTGSPLIILHENTASSKMYNSVIPAFQDKYQVVTMDFLGCGQSERINEWPSDLWYNWGEQAAALCSHLGLTSVNVIGCSGGALAGINMALEHSQLVKSTIADSFEGLKADESLTEQIRMGRNYAKQMDGFRSMLMEMHGEDWEAILDADTNTVVRHAQNVKEFFHKLISELQCNLLLTGSAEDEMFSKGHYDVLFNDICTLVPSAKTKIFKQGSHPAMLSNLEEFVEVAIGFMEDRT